MKRHSFFENIKDSLAAFAKVSADMEMAKMTRNDAIEDARAQCQQAALEFTVNTQLQI